jgi:hypothetical protein
MSRPASRHGSLNSHFQVALYLPFLARVRSLHEFEGREQLPPCVPHDGLRPFHQTSTCLHAIDFRALCGARSNLALRGNITLVVHRVDQAARVLAGPLTALSGGTRASSCAFTPSLQSRTPNRLRALILNGPGEACGVEHQMSYDSGSSRCMGVRLRV